MESDEGTALAGALQFTNLSSVVVAVTNEAYGGLKEAISGEGVPDEEKYVQSFLLPPSSSMPGRTISTSR